MRQSKHHANPPFHLLVPIQVDALVVEEQAEAEQGVLRRARARRDAGTDFCWSAGRADYREFVQSLLGPGPGPFQDAEADDGGVMALPETALPRAGQRGVYLRWLVPDGLRKPVRPNGLDYPALPDQWLVLRCLRRKSVPDPTLRAWFVDGGAVADDAGSASLLLPASRRGGSGEAPLQDRRVGRVVPLELHDVADAAGREHCEITALGSRWTGSPTFCSSLAENRNILSWHDDLAGLRGPSGDLDDIASASYAVVGWYRDPAADPLRSLGRLLSGAGQSAADHFRILDHLGWVDPAPAGSAAPDLCVFHGAVAHINYWDRATYHGPLLGYPQSPRAHAGGGAGVQPLTVALGASFEAAFAALLSEDQAGEDFPSAAKPKWAALEGHLLGVPDPVNLPAARRRQLTHSLAFKAFDAGQSWSLVRVDGKGEGAPPALAVAALAQLNRRQETLNRQLRELVARFRANRIDWIDAVVGVVRDGATPGTALGPALGALNRAVAEATGEAGAIEREARDIERKLTGGWTIRREGAPRFWAAADPVLMIAGLPTGARPPLPAPLPCRRITGLIETASAGRSRAAPPAADAGAIARLANDRRLPHAMEIGAILREALLVEHAVAAAAVRDGDPADARAWREWTAALRSKFRSDSPGRRTVVLKDAAGGVVAPELVAAVWGEQPWSPRFIDWQVGWSPLAADAWTFDTAQAADDYDYRQAQGKPAGARSVTPPRRHKGRSLLAPVGGAFVQKALAATRAEMPLNAGDVDRLLDEGVIGQELSGLVAALAGFDIEAPLPDPDPARPWLDPDIDGALKQASDMLGQLLRSQRVVMPRIHRRNRDGDGLSADPLPSGWFNVEHLWVVDDFGQWVELSGKDRAPVLPHPRSRHRDGRTHDPARRGPFLLPPRLPHPARLDAAFVATQDGPVRGWVYVNRLDDALTLCGGDGRLLGELAFQPTTAGGGEAVVWRPLGQEGGIEAERIADPRLRGLALWALGGARRLRALITHIERTVTGIRLAETGPEQLIVGRPLALVDVMMRIAGYEPDWKGPDTPLPLRIGRASDRQDGVVGYVSDPSFGILHPIDTVETPRLDFGRDLVITLLLDPFGSVELAAGVLPAKTLTLPADLVRAALATLDISFGVGPVLAIGGKPMLPLPLLDGQWVLRAPGGGVTALPAYAPEPRFDGAAPSALDGRLILRRKPPASPPGVAS